METKYFYFDNKQHALVEFTPTYIVFRYKDRDWAFELCEGKTADGQDATGITKAYRSVEDYQKGKELDFDGMYLYRAIGAFKRKHTRGDNVKPYGDLYYIDKETLEAKTIHTEDYDFIFNVLDDDAFLADVRCVKDEIFYESMKHLSFCNDVKVISSEGESTIKSQRSKFAFTDEQQKELDKLVKQVEKLKSMGVNLGWDNCDGNVFAIRDTLRTQWGYGDGYGEEDELNDFVVFDEGIIRTMFSPTRFLNTDESDCHLFENKETK